MLTNCRVFGCMNPRLNALSLTPNSSRDLLEISRTRIELLSFIAPCKESTDTSGCGGAGRCVTFFWVLGFFLKMSNSPVLLSFHFTERSPSSFSLEPHRECCCKNGSKHSYKYSHSDKLFVAFLLRLIIPELIS